MTKIPYMALRLSLFLSVVHGISVGDDGQERYETALSCTYMTVYFSFYYGTERGQLTPRQDMDCCYLTQSRNRCCLSVFTQGNGTQTTECRCDPELMCGDQPSTETATTISNMITSTTNKIATTITEVTASTSQAMATTRTTSTTSTISLSTILTASPTTITSPTPITTRFTTTTATTTAPPTSTSSTTTLPSTTTISSTTTTTSPSTTTTLPSTTTTSPSTTTTSPSTTTTLPSTTTTSPSTTTTSPSTTSTATPTTTTSFRSLCSWSRVLNGNPVDNSCMYPGVAKIFSNESRVLCNAVYARVPVDSIEKDTFLTTKTCIEQIVTADLIYNDARLPIVEPIFNLKEGPNGNAFIDLNANYASLLSPGCQNPACGYSSLISSNIDFNDCRIVSYGNSDTDGNQNGLNEVKLHVANFACGDLQDLNGEVGTWCFSSDNGENVYCTADSGAPVYCRAPVNGEFILMGVTASQEGCNTSRRIKVIALPS